VAVRLVFLGRLADLAGASDKVRVAINGAVLADKTTLAAEDGDEVALLPPVSGG
jgi:molybdopterin synthase sulfur carrier subunit